MAEQGRAPNFFIKVKDQESGDKINDASQAKPDLKDMDSFYEDCITKIDK